MSIPPQLIRVKRKRADDESPVAFLQFDDDGAKRHRTGNHWVYQRRDARDAATARLVQQPDALAKAAAQRDVKPVIHISKSENDKSATSRSAAPASPSKPKTLSPRPSLQKLRQERRRFHLSRSALSPTAAAGGDPRYADVSQRRGKSPAVFVEKGRRKLLRKALENAAALPNRPKLPADSGAEPLDDGPQQVFKKPATSRAKPAKQPQPPTQQVVSEPARTGMPSSFSRPHTEDMDKIADDMNKWVLDEIGANLQQMDIEKKQAEKPRFKPRAPPKRRTEGHQNVSSPATPSQADTAMQGISDEEAEDDDDDDDWVIDEYVRIPAKSMAADVSPTDVGVLVLDGEDDNSQFFGDEHDEDDEYAEDDEDENAENHYTADYPEDEVDSDDEYGRHAYYYRNNNASDDEEFDNDNYNSDSDEVVLDRSNDDEVTMARIKAYMRRQRGY